MVTGFATDAEFHEWQRTNPNGYVLNVRRNPSADYLVLHTATCRRIERRRYASGALTERSYRKIGADRPDELAEWIRRNVPAAAGFSVRCSHCRA